MAKKEIIWTSCASQELYNILDFYIERNQNAKYSILILQEIDKRIQIISQYPNIGHPTQLKNVRLLPYKEFGIIYRTASNIIYIESIWHFKRNPKDRKDNK